MVSYTLTATFDALTTGRLMFDLLDDYGDDLLLFALYGRSLRGEGGPTEAFALVRGIGATQDRDIFTDERAKRYRFEAGSRLVMMDPDGEDWIRFRERLQMAIYVVYEQTGQETQTLLSDTANRLILL
ncbi:hypothetical protein BH11ARM2_BH11ARM2_17670 [soil metagenome]